MSEQGLPRRTGRTARWALPFVAAGVAAFGLATPTDPGTGPAAATTVPVTRPAPGATRTAAPAGPTLAWEQRLPGVTIRESSPVLANLGRPAVVVGALNAKVYAFSLASGHVVPGWPVPTNAPVNSSPAAADVSGTGTDQVFVGAGTADRGQCSGGGVFSFGATGALRWARAGFDPNCPSAREPFHSSPTIGDTVPDGTPKVVIGALGLNDWSLNADGGGIVRGWPIYTDDTSFSTAALAAVPGEAAPVAIIGGDASPGGPEVDAALGMPLNWRGGVVRAVDGAGKVLWQFFTDDMVRSSPAVGDITGDGQPSVVFGTGDYWYHQPGGAHDSTKVFALALDGQLRWSRDLHGVTLGSPALADVDGTGVADVVIGTAEGPDPGKVWVLDGSGNPLPHWAGHDSGGGEVIGSITTADLTGDGAQDLLVPTGQGVFAYDGRTGKLLFVLDRNRVVVQGSPLITQDRPGVVGITIAGTTVGGVGIVQHFTVPVPAPAIGPLSWPMFHHDARHTGNLAPPPLTASPCQTQDGGYWVASRDGGVFGFCDAPYDGSGVGSAHAAIVAMAPAPGEAGYWLASASGGVYTFGKAGFYGALASAPKSPIVAMAVTPSGHGYWLASASGGVYAFGDAAVFGSAAGRHLGAAVTGIASTPSGRGYWLVLADGGVLAFGDAPYLGAAHPRGEAVGIASSPSGRGYWVVAGDGGVFAFGDALFAGSAAASHLGAWVVGMAPTPSGRGYWLVSVDGGVFSFGDARFLGSAVGIPANQPVVGMAVPAALT